MKDAFANSAAEVISNQNSAAEILRGESQRELLLTMYNSGVITDQDILDAARADEAKYKYGRKWFHQEWDALGGDAVSAENLAFSVGTRKSDEFEYYKDSFDIQFITPFSD